MQFAAAQRHFPHVFPLKTFRKSFITHLGSIQACHQAQYGLQHTLSLSLALSPSLSLSLPPVQ